ncbi:MAG: hypothetical protein ABIE22_05085 [archaeon]
MNSLRLRGILSDSETQSTKLLRTSEHRLNPLFDSTNLKEWPAKGYPTALKLAQAKVSKILSEHHPEPLTYKQLKLAACLI